MGSQGTGASAEAHRQVTKPQCFPYLVSLYQSPGDCFRSWSPATCQRLKCCSPGSLHVQALYTFPTPMTVLHWIAGGNGTFPESTTNLVSACGLHCPFRPPYTNLSIPVQMTEDGLPAPLEHCPLPAHLALNSALWHIVLYCSIFTTQSYNLSARAS